MKRLSLFLVMSIFAFGSVFAQGISQDKAQDKKQPQDRVERQDRKNRQDAERPDRNNRQNTERPDRNNRQRELKTVTVEGTLQLNKGFVAVESGDSVYFVPMLNRYIGFIEGLKEGAKVAIEGFEARKFIQPKKVTINGKDYDFIARAPNFMNNNFNRGQKRGDFGPGRAMQWQKRGNAPRANFGRRGCR